MKKGLIITLIIVVLIAVLGITTYNGLVEKSEDVETKLADIDTALQRRLDLIPNLVSTVKGYMTYEEGVISDITTARENMAGATTTADKLAANDELTSAINNLLVVVENYPDLKADTQFTTLQDELAGSENRIANARREYNESVKTYNTAIKKFPASIFAGMLGYEAKDYFEASEEANTVPTVDFE